MTIKRRIATQNKYGEKKVSFKADNFAEIIWPRMTTCNPARNYIYVTGGLNENTKQVSD